MYFRMLLIYLNFTVKEPQATDETAGCKRQWEWSLKSINENI